ncbi:MAG TPA: zinc-binding dehydrogenase [Elusimicrobiota bacterium]|nr:zinc-binding dehydrogenase [Elusimicrobiota bacterium]
MRAVWIDGHGGLDVLRVGERPRPVIGPDDVLVRVRACALNHLDIWVREGLPGLKVDFPHILGSDAAGVIEEIGDNVRGWVVGQPVLAAPGLSCGTCVYCQGGDDHLCDAYDILGQRSQGAYAEFVRVPAANLFPIPAPLTFEEAASLPLVFLTAWQMLVVNGDLRAGQTVLVHAGGSGVGIAAIQIAKAHGARVLTTVGSIEKAERAQALGADAVVFYRDTDFATRVQKETGGRGVDLVVEHIGQATFEKSLQCLTKGGRLLTCGATSGRQVQFDLRQLFGRNLTVRGSRMGRRDGLGAVLEGVRKGVLKPVVDWVFPLEDAASAHRRMEERLNFGKIVLSI